MAYPTGSIPIIPLRNTVIYPGMGQYLRVGREKSLLAIQKVNDVAENETKWIIAVAQKDSEAKAEISVKDLYHIGTLCKVETLKESSDGSYQLQVKGQSRVRLLEPSIKDGFFQSTIEVVEDVVDTSEVTNQALLESIKNLAVDILKLIPANTDPLVETINKVYELSYMTYLVSANIEMIMKNKQEILEEVHIKERTMKLLQLMQELKENLKIQSEIRSKISNKIGESQRQSILREQLKTIREELGEGDEGSLFENYRKKITEAGLPEEANKIALQELSRFEQISAQSPEHHIIRSYLDFMLELPWSTSASESEIDLNTARRILDHDHYGLDKVKKRILQHLAVMKIKKKAKGTILLFVGPPGVGKTSLGQSIAEALGRKFIRVSFGGVRDEAEIRGHRRTYVGAMPGRILTSIKRAGQNNPVLMMDEVDKLARGFQGDPASALLEVLDPEQNFHFQDHYLDTGFDLSKVIFIATANTLDTIPAPLLDRMEIIEVTGYSTPEKLHIAKNHLIPKVLEEHGLSLDKINFNDEVILKVITGHTREAGVRDLQRKIAALCRGSSEKILTEEKLPVIVTSKDIEEILGPERYSYDIVEAVSSPGVVTGLAWTPQGGDILFIESTLMPGSGQLLITGQLGDVMKESTQIALSLLRSRLPILAPHIEFNKYDIHIHVPAGAIPKDGPSAGVTMLTSIASLFSRKNVNPRLAMTGEITLRGSVTPVGGIKEKVIAAHRAGIEHIILPKKNEKDLRDFPPEIKAQLQFSFVQNVNEVLKIALDYQGEFLDSVMSPSTPLMMNFN